MSRRLKIKIGKRLLRKKLKPLSGSKKRCRFTSSPALVAEIDYKNVDFLRNFVTDRGKILPARVSGSAAVYQRRIAKHVKLARVMALLPYCALIR